MERHTENAQAIAAFLVDREDVAWARHPGIGGMVSFIPREGGRHGRSARERAIAICEATRVFTLAESLGGVESLLELPSIMTHASVADSPLEVEEALIRLSVGIEHVDDLIEDLRAALDGA
jgi:cystathionine gamma-synthase